MFDNKNPYAGDGLASRRDEFPSPSRRAVLDGEESFSVVILAIISAGAAFVSTSVVVFLAGGIVLKVLRHDEPFLLLIGVALMVGTVVSIPVGIRSYRKSTQNPADWTRDYDPLP